MRRSSRFSIGAAALGLTILSPALAQDATDPNAPSTQGNVSVTVYNGGISLVQDIRKLNIAGGTSRLEFPDVSAQIRPETVSFAADGATIVEQNFDYDLLTPGKLMDDHARPHQSGDRRGRSRSSAPIRRPARKRASAPRCCR